jgi:uncharacterized protein YbjT (DUF2867 family)
VTTATTQIARSDIMTLVLVTGGTGRAGRPVVQRLHDAGRELRVLSHTRPPAIDGVDYVRADLATGEGVDQAVDGASTIIHCAGAPGFRRDQAMTANLIRAAQRLPAPPHLVKISVVGVDRVPVGRGLGKLMFGYFASMAATERAVERSGLPWTTLRATQFFDAIALIAAAMARLPLIPVPSGIRFQPVDTREVADRLIELALGPPAGLAPDFAGPTAYPMADLVRGYLGAVGRRRPLMPVHLPGTIARAVKDGANLPAAGATLGHRSWEEFLAEQKA